MRVSFLRLFLTAALLIPGAALCTPAQSAAQRKAAPRPAPTPEQGRPKKVTNRPGEVGGAEDVPASARAGAAPQAKEDPNAARYVYEFKQPDFYVYFVHIEHDDAGRGQMRFERRSDTEQTTEPFEFSPTAIARVRARWEALQFLEAQANYQGERTYPSMGQTRLSVSRGGRERTTEFNYSQNADAQGLADEYRRATEQALFVFDIGVAVESQPLETPKLLGRLEALVGRNHAARILKKLEKQSQ